VSGNNSSEYCSHSFNRLNHTDAKVDLVLVRLEQLMVYLAMLAKRAVLGVGIGFAVIVTCHRPGSQTASGPPACSTPVVPTPPPASCEAERQQLLLLTETTHDLSRALAGTLPVPQIQEQATGTLPGAALSVVLRGMKMPDKPLANWLRPDKHGVCRNPETGEELRPQAVIRGTCWDLGSKMPNWTSCPKGYYDPPSEVLNDPFLRKSCFTPYLTEQGGTSFAPHP